MYGVESEAVSLRTDDGFEPFFARCEPSLRAALVSRFGPEAGRKAAAEALGNVAAPWLRAAIGTPDGYLALGDHDPDTLPVSVAVLPVTG